MATPALGATLTSATSAPGSLNAGATSIWTWSLKQDAAFTAGAGNSITITWPTAFTVPAVPTVVLKAGFTGTGCSASATSSNGVAVISLGSTCALAANTKGTFTLAGVTNPAPGAFVSSVTQSATSGFALETSQAPFVVTSDVTVVASTPTNVVTNSRALAVGSVVTFTATLKAAVPSGGSAATPTGTITWTIAGTAGVTGCASTSGPTGSSNVVTFTCTTSVVTQVGTLTASAAYGGDANYNAVTSATDTLSSTSATPTNVVTNSGAPTVGGVVTFTATISAPAGAVTPTGTLTWTIAGTAGVTSCASTSGPTGSSNVVTFTCTTPEVTQTGTVTASAAYGGDANYNAKTSATNSVTTAKATPSNVVSDTGAPAVGDAVTFTATISAPAGATTPGGSVNWTIAGTAGVRSCASTSGPTGSSNVVTYTCTTTVVGAVGTVTASAAYRGDANYAVVTSATDTLSSTKVSPTVTVSALPSSSSSLGVEVTMTATTGPGQTGTVQFEYSSDGVSFTVVTGCVNPVSIVAASATCATSALPRGVSELEAIYSGDSNYAATTSSPLSYGVAPVPTIVTPSNVTINAGTSFSLTISSTVVNTPGTFSSTGASLPAGIDLNAATGVLSGVPAHAGTYDGIVITETDHAGAKASTSPFSILVVLNSQSLWLSASNSVLVLGTTETLSTGGHAGSGAISFTLVNNTAGCTINGDVLSALRVGSCDVTASIATDSFFAGHSSNVLVVAVDTTPDPPGLSATLTSDSSASISVVAPVNDGGAPVTSYTVTASPGGESCSIVVPQTSCDVTNLVNGVTYVFNAVATNLVGSSLASTNGPSVTPLVIANPPQDVSIVTGTKGALISWTAQSPTNVNATSVAGFIVTTTAGLDACTTRGATSCVVTGLDPGATYQFQVQSVFVGGDQGIPVLAPLVTLPLVSPRATTNFVTKHAARAKGLSALERRHVLNVAQRMVLNGFHSVVLKAVSNEGKTVVARWLSEHRLEAWIAHALRVDLAKYHGYALHVVFEATSGAPHGSRWPITSVTLVTR